MKEGVGGLAGHERTETETLEGERRVFLAFRKI